MGGGQGIFDANAMVVVILIAIWVPTFFVSISAFVSVPSPSVLYCGSFIEYRPPVNLFLSFSDNHGSHSNPILPILSVWPTSPHSVQFPSSPHFHPFEQNLRSFVSFFKSVSRMPYRRLQHRRLSSPWGQSPTVSGRDYSTCTGRSCVASPLSQTVLRRNCEGRINLPSRVTNKSNA